MTAEDAATVLEDFIIDVANLPAEVSHYLEEIAAKDTTIQECRNTIRTLDAQIQKFVKLNGGHVLNPKEEQFNKTILASFDRAQALQNEKILLIDKAQVLLDRHTKKLDQKIRDLQREGTLARDPPLPSLLHTSTANRVASNLSGRSSTGTSTPIGETNLSTTLGNAALTSLIQEQTQPLNHRSSSHPLSATRRAATPTATHHPTLHLHTRHRDTTPLSDTATTINKRRRLNASLGLPSSLNRHSSLDPSTPKTSTLSTSFRGNSVPRSTSSANIASRKSTTISKKIAPHHQTIRKLKATTKSSTSRKRGTHPRNSPVGDVSSAAASDDDSLSEVVSETSNSASRGRITSNHDRVPAEDEEMEDVDIRRRGESEDVDMEEEEVEADADSDDKKYCTCRSVSYGNMVACDNEDCPYEWFHWSCVGLTKEPEGSWYCDECTTRLGL